MGAFDDKKDDSPPQAKQRVGLKLNNSNSMFANAPKKPTQAELDQAVKETAGKDQDYKERAATLAASFTKLLNDKKLVINKNIFEVDMERDVIVKLGQLGLDLDNDDIVEEAGMGSIGLINLLFRSLLIQRDNVNDLDYKVHELELKLKTLVDKPDSNG